MRRTIIGVLGLQGDFEKHAEMLHRLDGVVPLVVRTPEEVRSCEGLIIPGGESTTVGKLMVRYGVDEAIKDRAREGMPIFGTCTGMILLAREIEGSDQYRLGLMDITVRRNAFGRQIDSFETDLQIPAICNSRPVRAVFIRAPIVSEVRGNAEVLSRLPDGRIVMVRQGPHLAAAFHPELTDDTRIHQYFVDIVRGCASA
ncbi:MAG: pyridoxal 5'-phosphate synthase glutaminase subunit PdxT [Armatimonadota bacterium]|nr:pyridoxal 5'-phosphate synthase glutaminase subunit PdxT [Armatimonadota bacterium]